MTERPAVAAGVAGRDRSDRTVLVTGSTSGVGRELAVALGRLGATVLVHGRDRDRGEAVATAVREAGGEASLHVADFLDLDAVRDLADAAATAGVTDLVDNVGAAFRRGELSAAGVERTFHVNQLAPYLLTVRLLDSLPADGRVVVTASEAHRGADLALETVVQVEDYGEWGAYQRSKVANVLFARGLAERTERPVASFHPGFIPGSGLWRDVPAPVRLAMRGLDAAPGWLSSRVASTAADGAARALELLVAPAHADADGGYYVGGERTHPTPPARDDDAADALWRFCAERTGEDLEHAADDATLAGPQRQR